MKRYEKQLMEAWNKLKEKTKTVVTIEDIEELNEVFSRVHDKIEEQRRELEQSRDNWKRQFQELKEK